MYKTTTQFIKQGVFKLITSFDIYFGINKITLSQSVFTQKEKAESIEHVCS